MRKLLLLLLTLLPIVASAYDAEIDGIFYNFNTSTMEATVTSGNPKYEDNVTIPETVTYNDVTYSVTSIGRSAFYECRGLTSVTIPESVTSISKSVFEYCSGLTSVIIPNSVTSIGNYAFAYCSGLTSVTIGNSVTSIGNDAFEECSGLNSVHISDLESWCKIAFDSYKSNPLYYAHHLFLGEEEILDLVIPNCVNSIGVSAFYGCSGLISVVIPNSVISIGNYAFDNCSSLTSIEIPNSVTSIGNFAFSNCSSLTSITIPNSVTSIGDGAFEGCSNLTTLIVESETPPVINFWTFSSISSHATLYIPVGCLSNYRSAQYWNNFNLIIELKPEVDDLYYNLDWENMIAEVVPLYGYADNKVGNIPPSITGDLVIPSTITYDGGTFSVTSISDNAFENCTGMTSVTIPKSVTTIGSHAFSGCSSLISIKVEEGNTLYDSRDNCNAIIETKSNTLIIGCKNSIIPNSVTSIGDGAFENCRSLTSITIPNNVTDIGKQSFAGCIDLSSVTICDGVTSIGMGAFMSCNITSLSIPNSVTSIGIAAFCFCTNLNSIIISEKVNVIGVMAFEACNSLTRVIVKRSTPPDVNNSVDGIVVTDTGIFPNPTNAILYVPNGCLSTYKNSKYWNVFKEIKELKDLNAKTEIDGMFYNLDWKKTTAEVTLMPDGNQYHGDIVIPSSIVYEGELFNVTSIGEFVFSGCTGITSVTIPNSVTNIGMDAFKDCSGLTSVHINDLMAWCKVSFVSNNSNPLYNAHHLFINDTEIKDLVIPEGLISIGSYAFQGCNGLTSVTISNSVTCIGMGAFMGCNNITSIVIPNSITGIDSYAFSSCKALNEVYCYAEDVPETKQDAFISSTIFNATLYVPRNALELYKTVEPWSNFGLITPLEGEDEENTYIDGIYYNFSDNFAEVTKGENAYTGDVVIPASVSYKGNTYNVTSIGSSAFRECSVLTSVTIPNSVTSIGDCAFSGCSGLTDITIPNSITRIEDFAFQCCI